MTTSELEHPLYLTELKPKSSREAGQAVDPESASRLTKLINRRVTNAYRVALHEIDYIHNGNVYYAGDKKDMDDLERRKHVLGKYLAFRGVEIPTLPNSIPVEVVEYASKDEHGETIRGKLYKQAVKATT
ncbi:MAG TPA: hypothetical protein VHE53_00035 [Patescibacteria group bacterium]|nr:hypothetical protein [Patescibacteria group bacterium]